METDAYLRVLDRLQHEVFIKGRIQGILDARDANYLNEFDALQSIRELLAYSRAEQELMTKELVGESPERMRREQENQ